MDRLPINVVQHIGMHLHLYDLLKLSEVSKFFYSCIHDNDLKYKFFENYIKNNESYIKYANEDAKDVLKSSNSRLASSEMSSHKPYPESSLFLNNMLLYKCQRFGEMIRRKTSLINRQSFLFAKFCFYASGLQFVLCRKKFDTRMSRNGKKVDVLIKYEDKAYRLDTAQKNFVQRSLKDELNLVLNVNDYNVCSEGSEIWVLFSVTNKHKNRYHTTLKLNKNDIDIRYISGFKGLSEHDIDLLKSSSKLFNGEKENTEKKTALFWLMYRNQINFNEYSEKELFENDLLKYGFAKCNGRIYQFQKITLKNSI